MEVAAEEGVVDVLAAPTTTSMPIEGNASIVVAVGLCAGITGVRSGRTVVPAAAD